MDSWDDLTRRLAQTYGAERARSIMAGRDPATAADLAKWRRLGEKKNPPLTEQIDKR